MYLRFDGSKSDDFVENDHLKIDRTILDLLAMTKCQSPKGRMQFDNLGMKIMTQLILTCDTISFKKIYLISKRQFEKYLSSRHLEITSPLSRLKKCISKNAVFLKADELEYLKDLIKGEKHSDEYHELLSGVEKYFLTSQYDNIIICLDHILSYEDFIKKLREALVKYNDDKDINQKILEDYDSVKVFYINKVYK
ncbi:MAG: hypothetical protein GU359_00630 [Desulfurococcales archaeon]|jgi:hypothetical protein|nr:hypothetical protein [Desulfurococcales archaeon]